MGSNGIKYIWPEGAVRLIVLTCFGLTLAAVMTVQPVEAQVLYGSLVGNVKDPSQAAVPGATVTITNQLTNASRETITTDEGVYSFATVHTGTYTLKVSLPGFKEFKQTDVQVTLNNVSRVDV